MGELGALLYNPVTALAEMAVTRDTIVLVFFQQAAKQMEIQALYY
jgi:hypothetical protein